MVRLYFFMLSFKRMILVKLTICNLVWLKCSDICNLSTPYVISWYGPKMLTMEVFKIQYFHRLLQQSGAAQSVQKLDLNNVFTASKHSVILCKQQTCVASENLSGDGKQVKNN